MPATIAEIDKIKNHKPITTKYIVVKDRFNIKI